MLYTTQVGDSVRGSYISGLDPTLIIKDDSGSDVPMDRFVNEQMALNSLPRTQIIDFIETKRPGFIEKYFPRKADKRIVSFYGNIAEECEVPDMFLVSLAVTAMFLMCFFLFR